MALSSYFRNMLDDIDSSVTLETELEHVKAYLMLEEARFEEHLKILNRSGAGGSDLPRTEPYPASRL